MTRIKTAEADWTTWWALMCDAGSTPRDCVRLYVADATDDECDYLLWEQSCFPVGGVKDWLPQIAVAAAQLRRPWKSDYEAVADLPTKDNE